MGGVLPWKDWRGSWSGMFPRTEAAGERFVEGAARLAGLPLDTGGAGNAQYDTVDVPPLRKNVVCVLLGLLLTGCGFFFFPNVSLSSPWHPYFDVSFDRETASGCMVFAHRLDERVSAWCPVERGRGHRIEKRETYLSPRPERGYAGNAPVLLSGIELPHPSFRSRAVGGVSETPPPSPAPIASCPRSPPV